MGWGAQNCDNFHNENINNKPTPIQQKEKRALGVQCMQCRQCHLGKPLLCKDLMSQPKKHKKN